MGNGLSDQSFPFLLWFIGPHRLRVCWKVPAFLIVNDLVPNPAVLQCHISVGIAFCGLSKELTFYQMHPMIKGLLCAKQAVTHFHLLKHHMHSRKIKTQQWRIHYCGHWFLLKEGPLGPCKQAKGASWEEMLHLKLIQWRNGTSADPAQPQHHQLTLRIHHGFGPKTANWSAAASRDHWQSSRLSVFFLPPLY